MLMGSKELFSDNKEICLIMINNHGLNNLGYRFSYCHIVGSVDAHAQEMHNEKKFD